ncbi:MAG: hypothetical protein M0R33_18655 [Methylomonas sp.]|jgi:hypothetical protein|uniref:hypothetical protein n=1 Tax=Methylomonas sp. TaxID=418 RepID=UPI0025D85A55|nr:hypothetical protein [Methylomonas sp.]MCK9608465.1 hypothetical protein [Methylomonas sp.]
MKTPVKVAAALFVIRGLYGGINLAHGGGHGAGKSAAANQQNPANYWHYCPNPEGYYPYVKECPGGCWQILLRRHRIKENSDVALHIGFTGFK